MQGAMANDKLICVFGSMVVNMYNGLVPEFILIRKDVGEQEVVGHGLVNYVFVVKQDGSKVILRVGMLCGQARNGGCIHRFSACRATTAKVITYMCAIELTLQDEMRTRSEETRQIGGQLQHKYMCMILCHTFCLVSHGHMPGALPNFEALY